MKKRILAMFLLVLMVCAALSACKPATPTDTGAPTDAPAQTADPSVTDAPAQTEQPAGDEPVYGGTLRVTINSDATSLDAMMVSTESDQIPATHIFETALSVDAAGNVFPGVCDYTFENNALTLTVREGVTFHDGNPVTVDDIYASALRWTENVSAAKSQIVAHMTSMEVKDGALVLTFFEPAPVALNTIAGYDQGLYVIPKAICEKYGAEKIADADCIGTGPYKFVEHLPDRYILVERYDGYVPTTNEATGMAAPKLAYVDQIYFYPVSDKTARITGVQTNEYDIGIGIPSNMIAELSADPNLVVTTRDLGIFAGMIFNTQSGPCADKNLRNAILACLNMDELMLAAQGSADLYYLNPCVMSTSSKWYVEDTSGKYNNVDLEAAQAYLDASSYNGETIVFITTKDNDYFYKTAIVVAQMVQQIGITMDVQVYDNATLKEYRDDATKYDIFSSGLSSKVDPTQVVFLDSSWAGFWSNERKDELCAQLASETDYEKRYAIWQELYALVYEEVPNISFGERINPIVYRSNVHNIFDTLQKFYWNTWIEG
ncbi:MAG TPA: ABC transporter substrate-binding protein [Clostridia bacterium]|nr:ABC transporter substrate-binding protein [Clostridia bacterium]